MTVFVAVLFVALTPGILVSLPPGGSKLTVALFHGVVFALVFHLTGKAVWHAMGGRRKETFGQQQMMEL
jgi:hypothetical protein